MLCVTLTVARLGMLGAREFGLPQQAFRKLSLKQHKQFQRYTHPSTTGPSSRKRERRQHAVLAVQAQLAEREVEEPGRVAPANRLTVGVRQAQAVQQRHRTVQRRPDRWIVVAKQDMVGTERRNGQTEGRP